MYFRVVIEEEVDMVVAVRCWWRRWGVKFVGFDGGGGGDEGD